MASEFDAILAEVRRLLEDGKSLAIATIDTPWGAGRPQGVDDFPESSIFKSSGGKQCVQWVVLPNGEVKCARYKDD